MKNKIFIIAVILFAPLLLLNFYFPSKTKQIHPPTPPANNNITSNFLFGSLQSVVDDGNDFANVNDLGLNMWHSYIGGKQVGNLYKPWGWNGENGSDQLDAPLIDYQSLVEGKQ